MDTNSFVRRARLPLSAAGAYQWHANPGALERLIPPWEDIRIVKHAESLVNGSQVELLVPVGPAKVRWLAEHRDCLPGRQFRDIALQGPFARWNHLHRFQADGTDHCWLEDRVEYALPMGRVGMAVAGSMVKHRLERMFRYRHDTTIADLALIAKHTDQPRWTIGITGASGLVGAALVPFLTAAGHRVVRIPREPYVQKKIAETEEVSEVDEESQFSAAAIYDVVGSAACLTPEQQAAACEQVAEAQCLSAHGAATLSENSHATAVAEADFSPSHSAIIHLAGEPIAAGRWTAARKDRIHDSRALGTYALCQTLAQLAHPPKVLICASAIGYYGNRGNEVLDEQSDTGHGFLASVAREWEAAVEPAIKRGIRVVMLRFGMILSPRGGALGRMLLPFRAGLGGRIGDGNQYWSWIGLDDVLGAIYHVLMTGSLSGPINVVVPQAVTNGEFAHTLAGVLHRPAVANMPAWAIKTLLGEMADECLLASVRAMPTRLLESGYSFRHTNLVGALRHMLGRMPRL